MKGWKKERIRRQKIRQGVRWRKQIQHDLEVWSDRMKEATLQTAMLSIFIENDKRGKLG